MFFELIIDSYYKEIAFNSRKMINLETRNEKLTNQIVELKARNEGLMEKIKEINKQKKVAIQKYERIKNRKIVRFVDKITGK
jgi:predicted RNase H-like nuclease (RuvC/YqgF family)